MSGTITDRMGRAFTGTVVGSKYFLDTTGSGPLAGISWDYCDVQQTSAIVETYVFKSGGSGGDIVKTIVVTYTAADKTTLDTVEVY